MVAERIQRRGWDRIDGIGRDQLLDIEYVAVVLVLRPCARPQQALHPRALCLQLLPAGTCEQALVALIGEFGICDRDLAAQAGERLAFAGVFHISKALVDQLVHRDIDAAHEETGDAGDLAGVAAFRHEMLKPRQIGFDDVFIDLLREQQRDVDVDAVAEELVNCRKARFCRRDLDHQVFAPNRAPEPPCLGDRRFGIHCQVGRDFQADISVLALRSIVDGAQRVRRMADVLDREVLIERHDTVVALIFDGLQRRIVIRAASDRLFEDRRVGRDACQPILLDKRFETAFGDEASREEVEPDCLSAIMQVLEPALGRFRLKLNVHDLPLDLAICSFAAASTLAGVNPNFVSRSLSGADEPNVFMPTLVPVAPT